MLEIDVHGLKALQETGEEFQLIDVREPYEFDEVNMGGLLIPLATIVDEAEKVRKDVKVIVHCRSGMRSQTAINALESRLGYNNLYNLKGGIMAWIQVYGLPESNS